jgi:hypothetical protein
VSGTQSVETAQWVELAKDKSACAAIWPLAAVPMHEICAGMIGTNWARWIIRWTLSGCGGPGRQEPKWLQ